MYPGLGIAAGKPGTGLRYSLHRANYSTMSPNASEKRESVRQLCLRTNVTE